MIAANTGPGVGPAAMRARQRVLRELRAAGATARESATSFDPRRPLEKKYLRSLKAFGAVKETGDGRLYLEEELVAEHSARRRKRVAGIATAAALMAVIVTGLTRA